MKTPDNIIDQKQEFKLICEFVKCKWVTTESLIPILSLFWQAGLDISKNHSFIDSDTNSYKLDILKMDFSQNIHSDINIAARLYHLPLLLQKEIMLQNDKKESEYDTFLRNNSASDLSSVYELIKQQFPDYQKNHPINWISLLRKYRNKYFEVTDDLDEYSSEFEGHNLINTGEFFPETCSIFSLLYREERENKFVPIFFIGRSIYQHAILVNKFNQSLSIKNEFMNIYNYFNQPEYKDKIVGEYDFSLLTSNDFILNLTKDLEQTSFHEIDDFVENLSRKQNRLKIK